jgi:hypothetical protein
MSQESTKGTKRTGEYPQMTQITQMSGIPEPNLRNLWNLWMSAPVPLHSAWPQRPLSDSACLRGQIGWSSKVLLTGSDGGRNRQKKAPDSKERPRKHEGNEKPQMTRSVTPLVPTVRCAPPMEGSRPGEIPRQARNDRKVVSAPPPFHSVFRAFVAVLSRNQGP